MTDRSPLLHFDDLAVGDRHRSASVTISREQITAFAAEFDPQPFHLDDDAARATLFGGLAASGWHTAALTMKLIVTSGMPFAGGYIGAGVQLDWPRPVRPGDTLHVESEVIELIPSKSKPDRGIVVVRNETKNERDEVVQVQTAKLVVPRRVAPG